MKKMLYIAFHNSSSVLWGVHSKILSQCGAFEQYGYEVELIERRNADTILINKMGTANTVGKHSFKIQNKNVRAVLDKATQMRDIKKYTKNKEYDACYIRYDFSGPGFIHLLKVLQTRCKKIVIELPTYPYEDENRYRVITKIKLAIDLLYRKQLHKYVDFFVTFYGGYEKLFDVPVVVIPNGFDFSRMSLVKEELSDAAIHMIAVSSMREWHGYERIIEGLRFYYADGEDGKENFVLHLVGMGREYNKYEALTGEYGLQKHIIMHGAMHGEKLDELYEQCAIAIDSLARHRSGIEVLSSLKSREYAAKGIPFINSCKIDVIEDDFPYMLRVPSDETPIDMEKVADFYHKCFDGDKSRCDIGKEIRAYMEKRSGMYETLGKVIKRIEDD